MGGQCGSVEVLKWKNGGTLWGEVMRVDASMYEIISPHTETNGCYRTTGWWQRKSGGPCKTDASRRRPLLIALLNNDPKVKDAYTKIRGKWHFYRWTQMDTSIFVCKASISELLLWATGSCCSLCNHLKLHIVNECNLTLHNLQRHTFTQLTVCETKTYRLFHT